MPEYISVRNISYDDLVLFFKNRRACLTAKTWLESQRGICKDLRDLARVCPDPNWFVYLVTVLGTTLAVSPYYDRPSKILADMLKNTRKEVSRIQTEIDEINRCYEDFKRTNPDYVYLWDSWQDLRDTFSETIQQLKADQDAARLEIYRKMFYFEDIP